MIGKGVSPQGDDENKQEKKQRVNVGFVDLEKAYDTVNRETPWQVLRMYDVGDKFLNGNSMYVCMSTLCKSK